MDKGNAAAENYDTMIISIWLSHGETSTACSKSEEGGDHMITVSSRSSFVLGNNHALSNGKSNIGTIENVCTFTYT
jgi:hypothetical protein